MVNARAAVFYASDLVPCLNSELEDILGSGRWVAVDENDEMNTIIKYENTNNLVKVIPSLMEGHLNYVKRLTMTFLRKESSVITD